MLSIKTMAENIQLPVFLMFLCGVGGGFCTAQSWCQNTPMYLPLFKQVTRIIFFSDVLVTHCLSAALRHSIIAKEWFWW